MAGAQEKTEKPTAKKLDEARKKGQVARSKDLTSLAVIAGGGVAVYACTGLIRQNFHQLLEELWGHGFSRALQGGLDASLLFLVARHFALMALPVLLSTCVIAVAISMFQTRGLLISLEAIQPDLSKLNPLQGLQRYFSLRSLVELAKSLFKVSVIGYAVYTVCDSQFQFCILLVDKQIPAILKAFSHLTSRVVLQACLIMLFLSLLDVYYQRWQYEKDMKMTKQEVKEEHKQADGDPQIKARIRAIQRSMAQRRMMAKVPKASVIITNPTHYAVALLYAPKMEAPRVVAKGKDFVAKKIIATGRKHRIPVVQNPPLARALYSEVEVDTTIPVSLYKAVAKVLAYIYQQQRRRPA